MLVLHLSILLHYVVSSSVGAQRGRQEGPAIRVDSPIVVIWIWGPNAETVEGKDVNHLVSREKVDGDRTDTFK